MKKKENGNNLKLSTVKNSKNILNKEMIGIILSLAWPTMLEQLMQTAAAALAGNVLFTVAAAFMEIAGVK